MSLLINWTKQDYCAKQCMEIKREINGNDNQIDFFFFNNIYRITSVIIVTLFSYIVYKKVIVPYNYIQTPTKLNAKRDAVNIVRKLRKVGEKLPPPFPNGWFCVAESKEVRKGKVKEVHCHGESLAVFRSDSGEVHVVDAYCPHLGANMAVGGIVSGDCIECPFHKWKFNGSTGDCVSIPNLETVPKNIHVRKWKSIEVNDMIMVWFHSDGIEPTYDIPVVKEIHEGSHIPMGRNEYYISCHIQDIPENGADVAHLNSLHGDNLFCGMDLPTNTSFNVIGTHEWSGEWKITDDPKIALVKLKHSIVLLNKFNVLCVDVAATQVGPSYVEMELNHALFKMFVLQYVTPVAPLLQKVVHTLYCPLPMKPVANLVMWAETVMSELQVQNQDRDSIGLHYEEEDKFTCGLCIYSSKCEATIIRHRNIHYDGQPHVKIQLFRYTTNKTYHLCNQCDYRSHQKGHLNEHMTMHSKDKRFKCDLCQFSSNYRKSWKNHMLLHNKDNVVQYKCDYCDYSSHVKYHLKKHMLNHNEDKPFKCDHCDYKSHHEYYMRKHILIHGNEKPYKCSQCDYSAYRKNHVTQHELIHNKDETVVYKCNDCDYSTHTKDYLRRHSKIHSKGKPFKCDHCDYRSHNKYCVNNHMLIHNKDKLFKCDQCDYGTHNSRNLARHVLIHDDKLAERFKCDQCDYSAVHKDNVKIHMLVHNKDKAYKCDQCDYRSHYKSRMNAHKVIHNKNKPAAVQV